MKSVIVNIPDSVDLSKVSDIKLCIRYYKDNDEYSYVTDGFSIREERAQGEWLWLGDSLDPNHRWSCNKCGRGVKEEENFCPNCGIMMQKGGAER